jgi:branched-chain amino acid aminotransferase
MATLTHRFEVTLSDTARKEQIGSPVPDFGSVTTDHMFIAEYANGQWVNARIMPFQNIPMGPASSVFHYGQAIFEGIKAYRQADGKVKIFRPEKNWERFNTSAERMAMPTIPRDLFMDSITELVNIENLWVPDEEGSSLYIRPFMIATEELLRVKPSDNFLYMVLLSPAANYYSKPLNILVSDHYTRADYGGTGFAKAAGNYARAMKGQVEAKSKGYDQMLWMESPDYKYIQESGTMNVFFAIGETLVTPALDGCILDGVTRDSIIQLVRNAGHKIEERRITIDEVLWAHKNNLLRDAFGTGTAASVAPFQKITYKSMDLELPPMSERPFSNDLKTELDKIKYGQTPDIFNWMLEI